MAERCMVKILMLRDNNTVTVCIITDGFGVISSNSLTFWGNVEIIIIASLMRGRLFQ